MNGRMQPIGFQERVVWIGEEVLSLADIWPETPRAMIVGLNPAPKSVSVGHYYQGPVGQRQLARLADAGLFTATAGSPYFEEPALSAGVGFTDLVKRPTVGEGDVLKDEQAHGPAELIANLSARAVPLVICVFRHPADAIMGRKSEVGFQTQPTPWDGKLFRMPGPFDKAATVRDHMIALHGFLSTFAG
jgi:TDG/mug DNA glycosylase family protein